LSRTSDSRIGPLILRTVSSRLKSGCHQLGAEKSIWGDGSWERIPLPKSSRNVTEAPDELPEAGIAISPSVKAERSHFFTVDCRVVDLEPVGDTPGLLVLIENEPQGQDPDSARFHGLDDDHSVVTVYFDPESDSGVRVRALGPPPDDAGE
jgi:hypothetical protein